MPTNRPGSKEDLRLVEPPTVDSYVLALEVRFTEKIKELETKVSRLEKWLHIGMGVVGSIVGILTALSLLGKFSGH